MKYIIFKDNNFFRLASTDEKKNHWLNIEPNLISKEVSNEDFRDLGLKKKEATLSSDGNIIWEIKNQREPGSVDSQITDASVIQDNLRTHIEFIKTTIKKLKLTENTEAQTLINFLDSIDVAAKTTGTTLENLHEYIYNLEGCPQIYIDDLTF